METVQSVTESLERLAPRALAQPWDNVGLMTGEADAAVTKILTALDVDEAVVEEAAACGANMILSHHPLIFSPLKSVTDATWEGRCILKAARRGIAIFSAHTNLDAATGGTNDYLAELYGLRNVMPLSLEGEENLGRIGETEPQPLSAFAETIAEKLGSDSLERVGDGSRTVRRVAICSGGGGSFISAELARMCDVYITGDVKYSGARDAHNLGLGVIIAPHYETEKYAMQILARWCETHLHGVETVCSRANCNVVRRG